MKPIPESLLEKILLPICEEQIREAKVEERTSPAHVVAGVKAGYLNRSVSAFVDDLDDPKACLVVGVQKGLVLDENMCVVYRVWVAEKHRKELVSDVRDMFETIGAYANLMGCDCIVGSSWVFQGSLETDALWTRNGFELQEKVFVKLTK